MNFGPLIAPTIILIFAVYTDIKTRKIPNKWILISIVLALVSSFYFYEFEGVKQGALAAGFSLLMTLPLVFLGALGAGDMKLIFAFGLSVTYSAVFSVIIFSFLWAAVIGIGVAVVRGRGTLLLVNTYRIITAKERDPGQLQKIPYAIALLLGWLTYIYFGLKQGALP